MEYRRFGHLEWKASALGFGAMRLPTIGEVKSNIDEAEAINMIKYAIDYGVNYVDTAYTYHGGNGEILVGKALKNGCREKVRVATKMPTWLVNSRSDMDKFLAKQLERLQLDFVDFYLVRVNHRPPQAGDAPLNLDNIFSPSQGFQEFQCLFAHNSVSFS